MCFIIYYREKDTEEIHLHEVDISVAVEYAKSYNARKYRMELAL